MSIPDVFGGDHRMTTLDLVLATVIAIALPFVCMSLLQVTGGALLPLVLYYGVCCIGVRWRKGTLDYRWPQRWPWMLWSVSMIIPLLIATINWGALAPSGASTIGWLATLLIWSPLNAAMEQLSWVYVLDAWRNHWQTSPGRWIGLVIGSVLLIGFIGLIHAIFWGMFLPLARPTRWSAFSIPLNFALTITYVALYYRSRSMWPVFFVHLVADLLVLLAHYSIIPDL